MADKLHDRRQFFQFLAKKTRSAVGAPGEDSRPGAVDISRLPDERLARLAPIFAADVELLINEVSVRVLPRGGLQAAYVARPSPDVLEALKRFNGLTTLGLIAKDVSAVTGKPQSECFSTVRGLFLKLERLKACRAVNGDPLQT